MKIPPVPWRKISIILLINKDNSRERRPYHLELKTIPMKEEKKKKKEQKLGHSRQNIMQKSVSH